MLQVPFVYMYKSQLVFYCIGTKPNIPGLVFYLHFDVYKSIQRNLALSLQVNNVNGDVDQVNSDFPQKFRGSMEYLDDNSTDYDKPPGSESLV